LTLNRLELSRTELEAHRHAPAQIVCLRRPRCGPRPCRGEPSPCRAEEEIEAAIAAHNAVDDDLQPLLPPAAERLLAAMFRRSSVCQRSVDDLATEGFDRRTVSRLLRGLIAAW
jgi:hypothetical protein